MHVPGKDRQRVASLLQVMTRFYPRAGMPDCCNYSSGYGPALWYPPRGFWSEYYPVTDTGRRDRCLQPSTEQEGCSWNFTSLDDVGAADTLKQSWRCKALFHTGLRGHALIANTIVVICIVDEPQPKKVLPTKFTTNAQPSY